MHQGHCTSSLLSRLATALCLPPHPLEGMNQRLLQVICYVQLLTWGLFLPQQRISDSAAMSPAMSAGLACSCLSRKLCTQLRFSAAMFSWRLAAAVSSRVAAAGGSSCKRHNTL